MKQRRWYCYDCTREWLPNAFAAGAAQWADDGCPACGSRYIEEIEYNAAFPGGDLPRVNGIYAPKTPINFNPPMPVSPLVDVMPPPMALSPTIDVWQLI